MMAVRSRAARQPIAVSRSPITSACAFGIPWGVVLGALTLAAVAVLLPTETTLVTAMAAGGTVAALVMGRALAIEVRVFDDRLVVRNLFRTQSLARADISGWEWTTVAIAGTPISVLGLKMRNGRMLPALGAYRLSSKNAEAERRRLKSSWPIPPHGQGRRTKQT